MDRNPKKGLKLIIPDSELKNFSKLKLELHLDGPKPKRRGRNLYHKQLKIMRRLLS